VYSRITNGEELTFGVSGKLIMNVLVMYDRQTESLWSQLLGEAVEGAYKGTQLEFLPSWQTTWEEWKADHPHTLALQKGYSFSYDPYEGYFSSSQTGVIGQTVIDDRLYVKEFVIGVDHNDEAVAYPYSVLNEEPVVNDAVGGTPVLVVFNSDTGTGVVFDRIVEEVELFFEIAEGLILVDVETGSSWDGLTGVAIDGPLSGKELTRIKSTASFWFGWKDFYPDTRVYGID
jgi:hypothetical protein